MSGALRRASNIFTNRPKSHLRAGLADYESLFIAYSKILPQAVLNNQFNLAVQISGFSASCRCPS